MQGHHYLLAILVILFFGQCKNDTADMPSEPSVKNGTIQENYDAITSYDPQGFINAIIEIPAGSQEKWELNKTRGVIERDSINGLPRTIDYLGYPANYGMIPQTLLSKKNGGDGDPLDVIVIGPPLKTGSIVPSKIIGILHLKDTGEQDDKLIATSQESTLSGIESLADLKNNFPGILEIIELWFSNYKGAGKMESLGYGDKEEALSVLAKSIGEYKSSIKK